MNFDVEQVKRLAESIRHLSPDDPYVTSKGGIVVLCGPFPLPKAEAIAEFYRTARALLPACAGEIERLQREIARLQDELATAEVA